MSAIGDGPWAIPGSKCRNCHGELAWRRGVGRVVITHAHGDDQCSFTCAVLTPYDTAKAQGVLDELDQMLQDRNNDKPRVVVGDGFAHTDPAQSPGQQLDAASAVITRGSS